MRRRPLKGRPSRLLWGILAVPLIVGCATAGPTSTVMPSPNVRVTIMSAPGETLAFEPAQTTVRAAEAIVLTFRNASNLPHNMVFTAGIDAATRTIVSPATSDELLLVSVGPGAYPFVCTIHDGMAGTLIVEPTAAQSSVPPHPGDVSS